nr:MAG TPA: hypothetical protein [Caudoviricetes sp.]
MFIMINDNVILSNIVYLPIVLFVFENIFGT